MEKKQEQIDKLYEENRAYKDGIIEQFQKKLVLGVIEQLDAAYKQISTFEGKEETEKNYKNLLLAFREIADDFLDMLRNRQGIIPFHSNSGERFDPTRHNTLRREPTGDQSKDTTISRPMRHGYANGDGSILRPELVEVFYYDASLPPTTTDTMEPVVGFAEEHHETPPLATPSDSEESRMNRQENTTL